jgi:hypothetical protein
MPGILIEETSPDLFTLAADNADALIRLEESRQSLTITGAYEFISTSLSGGDDDDKIVEIDIQGTIDKAVLFFGRRLRHSSIRKSEFLV